MAGGVIMEYLIYCNIDDDGNIIDGIDGIKIIPDKQYEYFFFLTEKVDLLKCKVIFDEGKPKLVNKN